MPAARRRSNQTILKNALSQKMQYQRPFTVKICGTIGGEVRLENRKFVKNTGWAPNRPHSGRGSLVKLKNAAVGRRIDTRLADHVVRTPTNRRERPIAVHSSHRSENTSVTFRERKVLKLV